MTQEYKTLLNFVGLLHKAHEGDRPRPFNLFSVLRGARDEVRLHSRFLAALLDHRDHRTKGQENLKDFLRTVLSLKDDRFDWTKSKVEKERSNIDILITLGDKVAIVIENKIDHQDSRLQLYTYWKRMKGEDFEEIHLVYLTLFGTPPSEGSIGPLDPDDVILVGYSSNTFQDWLRNCQRRAFDEPELCGSIVQYLQLVRELTDTDRKGGYMDALKELLKEGQNLRTANEIALAIPEARIDRELYLWDRVKERILEVSVLEFDNDGGHRFPTLSEAVRNYHKGSQDRYGYGIRHAVPDYKTLLLKVTRDDGHGFRQVCYGVTRAKDSDRKEFHAVKKLLEENPPLGKKCKSDEEWVWLWVEIPDPANGSADDYKEEVGAFAEEIARGMDAILKAVSAGT